VKHWLRTENPSPRFQPPSSWLRATQFLVLLLPRHASSGCTRTSHAPAALRPGETSRLGELRSVIGESRIKGWGADIQTERNVADVLGEHGVALEDIEVVM